MKAYSSKFRALAVPFTLLAAALAQPAFAQTTATTVPVGFITKTIFGNTGSLDGNTALSIPLYNTPDFQGKVSALTPATTAQFKVASATGWIAGQFAMPSDGGTATVPRLVRIKSGAQVGKFFRVTGNTASPDNELTVDLTLYGLANINTVLAVDDTVELVPANTIGSVFGTPPTGTPTGLSGNTTISTSDNVLLQNGAGWLTYFWKTNAAGGAKWISTGTTDRANTIIYPDTGVYVLRRAVGDISITMMGTVPATDEKSDIENPTFLSNRFPTDTTLGALGLENLPGWVKNTTASTSDNVYILQPSGAWSRYFYHSTANMWRLTGTIDRGTTPIPAGTAVYISYAAGSSNPATKNHVVPYTP